jgi:hypothetical protein
VQSCRGYMIPGMRYWEGRRGSCCNPGVGKSRMEQTEGGK